MAATALKLEEEERHIIEILPLLLKKDPRFRREVSFVLSETLATKDELNRVLEEIRISREEANRRFEAMDRKFEARFEAIDRRFEAMDRRFEESDRRFDSLVQEMHRGFELQSKATKDLEIKVDNGLKATKDLEIKVDNGFKDVDNRFKDLEIKVDNGLKATKDLEIKVDNGFKDLEIKIDNGLKATRDLGIKIDTVGARWGIFAEVTIRNTLKELLLKNLNVTEVKKWKVQDTDGFVFGYSQEIQGDLLIKNGEDYLIEIKSSAGSSDVTILHRKAKLYEQITGVFPKTIFVAVDMREEGKKSCQELNIQVITYDEIKD